MVTVFQDSRLSNFYCDPILFNDTSYMSVEHFYQSGKASTKDDADRIITSEKPSLAKQIGSYKIKQRDDFDSIRILRMTVGVGLRMAQHPNFATIVMQLNNHTEYNTHHDNFWGYCQCNNCSTKPKMDVLGCIYRAMKRLYGEDDIRPQFNPKNYSRDVKILGLRTVTDEFRGEVYLNRKRALLMMKNSVQEATEISHILFEKELGHRMSW